MARLGCNARVLGATGAQDRAVKAAALMGCGDGADACLAWARALGLRQAVIKFGAIGAMVIDAAGARPIAQPP
ncbi:hypothetical protein ACFQS6_00960 [Xanthomonas populi]|uniref:hypothetical protein n=1 Tax=Xanthomonas populi TaxID=53414 RepID=UPI001FC956E4|nr:hypothetical protein [Xanthomonas populi]